MKKQLFFSLPCCLFLGFNADAQGDNEIQVYASPTVGKGKTIFELHNNYTFHGAKDLANPKDARWLNNTLEITTGLTENFEIGFYTFAALSPDGRYQYLGNQIRPRITAPDRWKLPFGASLSVEFGFFRDNETIPYYWQGEIRPILDKTIGNFYVAVNPNIDFVLLPNDRHVGFSPQSKVMYSVKETFGLGVEYYSGLGSFNSFLTFKDQEHLLGPIFDLLKYPDWELQTGFLFGLTPGSNQSIFKLLVGRRFG